jgi:hypothetical protein
VWKSGVWDVKRGAEVIRIEMSAAAYAALATTETRSLLDPDRSPEGGFYILLLHLA